MRGPGDPQTPLLVDPAWLWVNRRDRRLRVVDCGPAAATWGPPPAEMAEAYDRGHVPGAVPLTVHNWLKDPASPLHLLGPAGFAAALGRSGVSGDTTVVAYDRSGGLLAARLWWALAYYGHRAAAVLDGGWNRWVAEGWAVTGKRTGPDPATFAPHPNESLRCSGDEVRRRLHEPGFVLLDTRSDREFVGSEGAGNPRTGHIPGAVHLEWTAFLSGDPPVTRPAAELRSIVSAAGLRAEDEVVTYCQAGVRAAFSALVLTHLGWPRVRVYDASMAEWAARDDTPMAVGPATGAAVAASPTAR